MGFFVLLADWKALNGGFLELQTLAQFVMARIGVLWRVLLMASYTAYVYCDKCDRPLRKNEYRMEVSPSDRNISIKYYCKLCGSNARGFDCVAGIPGSLMAIVGLLLVPPFLAFFYEPGAGMDMEILSFFYKCMPFPAFLFLLFHYCANPSTTAGSCSTASPLKTGRMNQGFTAHLKTGSLRSVGISPHNKELSI